MNVKISADIYSPKGKVRGNVLIIHGMCDHKGRYKRFCEDLASEGYLVYAYDQIGHGETYKDELGYFGDGGWNNLVETAHNMCIEIRKQNDAPLFVFGHSMGSVVGRSLLKRYSTIFDGLILSGPPCYETLTPVLRRLLQMICIFAGKKRKINGLYNYIIEGYNKHVSNPRTKYDWLSYNEENVDNYINDEYCGYAFTNSAYLEIVNGLIDIHQGYDVKNNKLPILFLVGNDDGITGFKKGVNTSITDLQKAGYDNIILKTYDKARHELLFENVNQEVIKDIKDFLNLNASSKAQGNV